MRSMIALAPTHCRAVIYSSDKKIDAVRTAIATSDIIKKPIRPGYNNWEILNRINVDGNKTSTKEMNATGRLATIACGEGISYCNINSAGRAAKLSLSTFENPLWEAPSYSENAALTLRQQPKRYQTKPHINHQYSTEDFDLDLNSKAKNIHKSL